jgi:hypothetical protein
MLLPNGRTLKGHQHLDLNRIETEFNGVYVKDLCDPTTQEGLEALEEVAHASLMCTIIEYLAEVVDSDHPAIKAGEGIDALFCTLEPRGIEFLGCYLKNSNPLKDYIDKINNIIFVFEFDQE